MEWVGWGLRPLFGASLFDGWNGWVFVEFEWVVGELREALGDIYYVILEDIRYRIPGRMV